MFFNNFYFSNSFENLNLKKLQYISNTLQTKIYVLSIRSTLNNVYITLTDNFGKVIYVKSGGEVSASSSKKNTNYNLELLLGNLVKKLRALHIINLMLKLDLLSLKKKKVVVKTLQKFQIKVLGLQLDVLKAFNGVRIRKRRRI